MVGLRKAIIGVISIALDMRSPLSSCKGSDKVWVSCGLSPPNGDKRRCWKYLRLGTIDEMQDSTYFYVRKSKVRFVDILGCPIVPAHPTTLQRFLTGKAMLQG